MTMRPVIPYWHTDKRPHPLLTYSQSLTTKCSTADRPSPSKWVWDTLCYDHTFTCLLLNILPRDTLPSAVVEGGSVGGGGGRLENTTGIYRYCPSVWECKSYLWNPRTKDVHRGRRTLLNWGRHWTKALFLGGMWLQGERSQWQSEREREREWKCSLGLSWISLSNPYLCSVEMLSITRRKRNCWCGQRITPSGTQIRANVPLLAWDRHQQSLIPIN